MKHFFDLRLLAACSLLLLLGVAGCDKDKESEPPAELIDVKQTLDVKELWSNGIGGGGEKLRLALGLALDNGVLYAASRDGEVLALDPANGHERWRAKTKLELSAGPGVGGGMVLAGTNKGDVVAFESATGKQLWQAKVSGEVLAAPLVAGTRVFVRTVDGRLRSLNAADGKEQWSAEEAVPRLSLRGTAAPVLAGEAVIAGFDSGKVMAFAVTSGDVLWQTPVSTPHGRSELARLSDVDAPVRIDGGDAFAVGYQGKVAMLAIDTGQVWWSRELSSYRALALDGGQLYVATSDGSVAALRRTDGTVIWQQDGLKRRGLSAPAVVGNAVVVGDFDGYLHWLDRETGKFVAREHPGGARLAATPITFEDRVFVMDEGGKIVAFRSGKAAGH